MGLFKKILGKPETSGWHGKSRSPVRKARIESDDGHMQQIICNNGGCPDVSFFVPKTTRSGKCPRCGTRWRT